MQITRRRGVVFGAALLGIVALVAGIAFLTGRPQTRPATQGPSQATADYEVCGALRNQGTPQAWDKALLDVENEALTYASPQVHDAYRSLRDAADGITPDPLHNALATAAGHFNQVCDRILSRSS